MYISVCVCVYFMLTVCMFLSDCLCIVCLVHTGIFYVRGNEKTVRLFDIAWDGYKVSLVAIHNPYNTYTLHIICGKNNKRAYVCYLSQRIEKESVKKNPGKDQNKVALALNIMRYDVLYPFHTHIYTHTHNHNHM